MTTAAELPPPTLTTCAGCKQTDDHPMQSIWVGKGVDSFGNDAWHPDDPDHDEFIDYHFDCAPQEYRDPANPAYALAESGVHGDELRAEIAGQQAAELHIEAREAEAAAAADAPAGTEV